VGVKYFTVDEANALVPALEAGLRRILLLRVELRQAYEKLEHAGVTLDPERLAALAEIPVAHRGLQGRLLALSLALAHELKVIAATGVEVKDSAVGLCDFWSERDGRFVLLCWQLGEPVVAHWHEVDAGFAGRRPLEPEARPRLLA
jgi:hypothetical protein